jgi:CDP-diacylglycerol--glycerol-3-phosphate 3-phosphatidyltransferase
VNLPNAISAGRIAAAPFVGWLPFIDSWPLRLAAFVLFLVVAISDYYDGKLARSRDQITDLGKQLDPLADKLFLVATFIPMYLLQRDPHGFQFVTPLGDVGLPLWVVIVVLGREVVMTIFRQIAAKRGVVIAAIGPAKWKTGFQLTWVGAAYFWFFSRTFAIDRAVADTAWWTALAQFNGVLGTVTMIVAVALTLYSLALYFRRYGGLIAAR